MLLGPRQVGKTTLARSIGTQWSNTRYLDLERAADLRRLEDADAYLRQDTADLILIDKVQRLPDLFPILRGVIDESEHDGGAFKKFLLLGSAALDLLKNTSESLAGRVSYLELQPLDITEAIPSSASDAALWVRGGFPRSFLAEGDTQSLDWRSDFIRTYIERDVAIVAPRLPSETIGRLWRMLAHSQGALLNISRLSSSLEISATAANRYIDLLVDLLLVRRLRPWSGNVGKRLTRSPKIYIRDSGLCHALLDLESLDAILGHPISGPSWEGFVIENLIAIAGPRRTPYFYRTEDGAEIDLLFERGGRVEFAIEVKRTSASQATHGFRRACAALKPQAAFIVHGGEGQWPLSGGGQAISLTEMMTVLA